MPLIAECSRCRSRFAAEDRLAGTTVGCPSCGASIQIAAKPAMAPLPETWFVKMSDGRKIGPVTRQQLDEAVAKGQVTAECQLWQTGWQSPAWANQVFPHLQSAPLQPTHFAPAYLPSTGSAAPVRHPQPRGLVETMFYGPALPDYQPSRTLAGKRPLCGLIVLAAVVIWGVLLVGASVSLANFVQQGVPVRSPKDLYGKLFAGVVAGAGGLFCLSATMFEWRFFFESRKARWTRSMCGDRGARYMYLGMALVMLLMGNGLLWSLWSTLSAIRG